MRLPVAPRGDDPSHDYRRCGRVHTGFDVSGETCDVLRQLFDAMVEVHPGDDGSEFRVRDSDFGPRARTSF